MDWLARFRFFLLIPLAGCVAALAQTSPTPQPPDPRKNQKVEKLRVEDRAVAIEEVRYGGQSQSVTVQPKGDAPAYEIQSENLSRSRPAERREGLAGATGQRVWNILSF
jgi:starvation-inducible outer membrane lipoprotein